MAEAGFSIIDCIICCFLSSLSSATWLLLLFFAVGPVAPSTLLPDVLFRMGSLEEDAIALVRIKCRIELNLELRTTFKERTIPCIIFIAEFIPHGDVNKAT